MARRLAIALLLSILVFPAASRVDAKELSFRDRVAAQEEIERVYFAHRIGETRNFEVAMPIGVIERKVRDYLRGTVALERNWGVTIDGSMLRRETERILRDSKDPQRLGELLAALDYDPVKIQECLARPVLVDRLLRKRHGRNPQAGEASSDSFPSTRFDAWWREPGPSLEGLDIGPLARVASSAREGSSSSGLSSSWSWHYGVLGSTTRDRHLAVWTGTEMIVWGGEVAQDYLLTDGFRYDPALDVSTPISMNGAPAGRRYGSAIWTGDEMIVWGGYDGASRLNTGARYDPATDSWSPVSTAGAPSARSTHSAIWTGTEMIVWGGFGAGGLLQDGGRYDPATDSWTPTRVDQAPAARNEHTAIWTGTDMIIWGGSNLSDGAIYDPTSDSWQPVSTGNAPQGRRNHTAVWTGDEMIVWGGTISAPNSPPVNTGGRYDPATDSWQATPLTPAPTPRDGHSAVWTGSEMIIWGGSESGPGLTDEGARYIPAIDGWIAMTTDAAPAPRTRHSAFWIGSEMMIWGGQSHLGGRYDPVLNEWTATFSTAPDVPWFSDSTAIWTGSEALVVGDGANGSYDPALDSWTSIGGAFYSRHTAVWTGSEMIVWSNGFGSRYDPAVAQWTSVATAGAPSGRGCHSAVWTGDRMIVWGGEEGCSIPYIDLCFGPSFGDGASYDPATDLWTPVSSIGAPIGRAMHAAVWTGTEMLVFGGRRLVPNTDPRIPNNCLPSDPTDGGRYDPSTDTWTTLPGMGRTTWRPTAVWTGMEMILFGGGGLLTPARYDPTTNAWQDIVVPPPIATFGPYPTSAWSGEEMIIWNTDEGAIYDPLADSWTAAPTENAPFPDFSLAYPSMVWTGRSAILFGRSLGNRPGAILARDDLDYDGVLDGADNCPTASNPTQDDGDADGTGEACDNCPGLANADQADADADALGDACDPCTDADGDGLGDPDLPASVCETDNCTEVANPDQADRDVDGVGDVCDPCTDTDRDGTADPGFPASSCPLDNCPADRNPLQLDTDLDDVGDLCDVCPAVSDPGQEDADGDRAGDACDCEPADPADRRPATITDLTAQRLADLAIALDWSAPTGADSYSVTRGLLGSIGAGQYGSCIAEGVAGTSYQDGTPLNPGEGFAYLLQAHNYDCGGGSLGYDDDEQERTNGDPGACSGGAHVDTYAGFEVTLLGDLAAGSYIDTTATDDVTETIVEEQTTGSPSTRTSQLDHRWSFSLPGGSIQELHVVGYRTTTTDGEDFVFEYSADQTNFEPIAMTSLPLADDDIDLVGLLPAGLAGSVTIRVIDSDRTPGLSELDSVTIDELFVRSLP